MLLWNKDLVINHFNYYIYYTRKVLICKIKKHLRTKFSYCGLSYTIIFTKLTFYDFIIIGDRNSFFFSLIDGLYTINFYQTKLGTKVIC